MVLEVIGDVIGLRDDQLPYIPIAIFGTLLIGKYK